MYQKTKSDGTQQLSSELEGFFSDFERQAQRKDYVDAARSYRSIIEAWLKLSIISSARMRNLAPEQVLNGRLSLEGKQLSYVDQRLSGNQLIQLAFSVPSIYTSGINKKQFQADYAEISQHSVHGRHPQNAIRLYPKYRSRVDNLRKLYEQIHGAFQTTTATSQRATSTSAGQSTYQRTTASQSTRSSYSTVAPQQTASLESALRDCQRATQQELNLAQQRLDRIGRMIAKAERELVANISELRQKKYADDSQGASPVATLEKAYTEIRTTLRKQLDESQQTLNAKSRQGGKLSIALFGKTTVGKSTLMSILTHGNSDQIGRGGQGTTKVTTSYEWNGISVTDTPGVEALGRAKDEEIALYAATQADIIVFLIDNMGTDKREADWFLKLQALDKPIILLCNERKSINSTSQELQFWATRSWQQNQQALQDTKNQFLDFLRHERGEVTLPPFYFVHLLSKQRADKIQDPTERERWIAASGVREFESQLIAYVTEHALPARRRAIQAIVDVPFYEHYRKFLQYAASQVNVFHSIDARLEAFREWKEKFVAKSEAKIKSRMHTTFARVKQSQELSELIAEYAESSSFENRFKQLIQRSNIKQDFENLQSEITTEANDHIQQLFDGLKADISLSLQLSSLQADTSELTNTRAWAQGIGGLVATAIAFIPGLNIVGAVGGIIWAFLSGIFDSREDKLRRRREQLREKCTQTLDKMRKDNEEKLNKLLKVDIAKKQFNQVETLIQRYKSPFLTLANSHRELAWEYLSIHTEISYDLVTSFLLAEGWSRQQVEQSVRGVARIPNQTLVIDLNGSANRFQRALQTKLQTMLGGSEHIQLMSLSTLTKEAALAKFLGYGRGYKVHEAGNITKDQEYVYVNGLDTQSKEVRSQIDLAQQLLHVHIIPSEGKPRPRPQAKGSKPNEQYRKTMEVLSSAIYGGIFGSEFRKRK